jgi:hypothetical protein
MATSTSCLVLQRNQTHTNKNLGREILPKIFFGNFIAVPDLVRYIFKATKLGKQDLGVPQLLRKRYI